jgi:glycerate kinase
MGRGRAPRVVVAFDKFRGSLTAADACRIAARVLEGQGLSVVAKPMADGGEGTAEALIEALDGEWVPRTVTGPRLDMRVRAGFAWFADRRLAVIEMARACGLALLAPRRRNPMHTSTRGAGELIAAAMRHGARSVWLAIGGSATVDGGIGAAAALGWRFMDRRGRRLRPVGGSLSRIARIVPPSRLRLPDITVLCDVRNPLCGPNGAAPVYGPQKGATPRMVAALDAGLRHLAERIRSTTGREVAAIEGGGAAGGLGAGAAAFFDARLRSGAAAIMEVCRLREALARADWVLTGEGRLDRQSLMGKVVSGVMALARRHGARVAVVAGQIALPERQLRTVGVAVARALAAKGLSSAQAMRGAGGLLAERVREVGRLIAVAGRRSGHGPPRRGGGRGAAAPAFP